MKREDVKPRVSECENARVLTRQYSSCVAPRGVAKKASPNESMIVASILTDQCPFQGNGRVYVVSETAALRQFLCFLPVLPFDRAIIKGGFPFSIDRIVWAHTVYFIVILPQKAKPSPGNQLNFNFA